MLVDYIGKVTMLCRTILVCFAGLILVKLVKMDPTVISFQIWPQKIRNNYNRLSCDHDDNNKLKNKYTVLEGEEFNIMIIYKSYVNKLLCHVYRDDKDIFSFKTSNINNTIKTYKAEKRMGALWNCTILTHRNGSAIHPMVLHEGNTYAAAYCYMKIHVRQTKSPQTILVNNAELKLIRTDSSVLDIDFTAEYQYADGDIVDVTCANFLNSALLTMEYPMADTLSDKFNSKNLSSNKGIGFIARLHSEHHNTYMICTNKEPADYTKVMVKFVMSTKTNIISIRINGMTLRPKLNERNYSIIEYKYISNQPINVVCEVTRTDMKLLVLYEKDFRKDVSSYKRIDTIQDMKSEISFHLNHHYAKKLRCASDYRHGGSTETVDINFTRDDSLYDCCPLHMDLPSNGTVMELYTKELKVIYYEFNVGETLKLNCYPLFTMNGSGLPLTYIQFKDSEQRDMNGTGVSQILHLNHQHHNSEIVCYLKELELGPNKHDKVEKEIKVILRERVPTATTTDRIVSTDKLQISSPTPPDPALKAEDYQYIILAAIAGVTCIVIICISTVIIKLRKRNHSQGGPQDNNYENLQNPSEAVIPPFPPQWESNYAVPADRRAEDTTYSVPCQTEPAVYATAVPKNKRKQKLADSTYSILDVQKAKGRKNVFKETDDPNYSEVYVNKEQCYGKVLPKSMRNKVVQDNNPNSYVANEPSYVNTAEPEPMYCEPNIAPKDKGGQYVNVNNTHYVNNTASEYVEPTYCEPHKGGK